MLLTIVMFMSRLAQLPGSIIVTFTVSGRQPRYVSPKVVAYDRASPAVQQFFVESYVRGARTTQETVGFEDSTA